MDSLIQHYLYSEKISEIKGFTFGMTWQISKVFNYFNTNQDLVWQETIGVE